jgi:hypothetical protein
VTSQERSSFVGSSKMMSSQQSPMTNADTGQDLLRQGWQVQPGQMRDRESAVLRG